MSTRDIKKGIFSSYGIFAADILSGILFTPFLIRSLGQSEYGVYSLMGAFVASLTVLDFGFGNAITRYVAQYRAESRKDKESNFFAMCLILYAVFAVIILLLGIGIFYFIDVLYGSKLSANELVISKTLFIIMIVNLSFSFFIGAFNAYIQGYEKFSLLNTISFFRLFIRIMALFVLLPMGFKSIAVILVDTAINLAMGIAYYYFARIKLNLKIKLLHFDKKLLKDISKYSSFVFLGYIADMMLWRMGILVLGMLVGAEAVAVYSVGITFISYFQYISGVINDKVFPLITQMVVRGASSKELTDFCSKIGRIQLILLGGILIGFQLFGKEFIHLWVGAEYSLSWWVGFILMAAMIVQKIQYPCVLILRAKKKDGLRTILQLIVMIMGALFGILLIHWLGVIGMSLGLAVSVVLLNWIIVNIHYVKEFGFHISVFLKQITKLLPSMGFAYIMGWLINLIPGYAWSTLCLKCVIFMFIYAILVWYLGANESEKAQILNLKRLIRPTVRKTQKA